MLASVGEKHQPDAGPAVLVTIDALVELTGALALYFKLCYK